MTPYKVRISVELDIEADNEDAAIEEALYWVKSATGSDLNIEAEEIEEIIEVQE